METVFIAPTKQVGIMIEISLNCRSDEDRGIPYFLSRIEVLTVIVGHKATSKKEPFPFQSNLN